MLSLATRHSTRLRAIAAALSAAAGGAILLQCFPGMEVECFAQGAARLASLVLGTPVIRVEAGWLLPTADIPVLVTRVCSATNFFLLVATLVAWQCACQGKAWWRAMLFGLVTAGPLAIGVNALRVVAVTQAHRWIIPHFPENFGPSLHLLTGVAVFLPALIALNLVFELHGRPNRPALDHA